MASHCGVNLKIVYLHYDGFNSWVVIFYDFKRNLLAQKNLARLQTDRFTEGESNLVWRIVTGDETWSYIYQDEPNPTKVKSMQSATKLIIATFF